MSPPTPGTLWRHLAPEEEGRGPFVVDGHVIPNGTMVGVNAYSLHHNEVSATPCPMIRLFFRGFYGPLDSQTVINEYDGTGVLSQSLQVRPGPVANHGELGLEGSPKEGDA